LDRSTILWEAKFSGRSVGAGVWSKSKPHVFNKLNYIPQDNGLGLMLLLSNTHRKRELLVIGAA
jgi:hypothetical protein